MVGSGGVPGGGGDSEEANFTKIDEKVVMIRSLDFTVEPDNSYRFRVRIVVVNPNKDHTDVNPDVDTESKELLGPWSDPTDPITVPADVAAYAQAPEQATRRDDLVSFQVIKWDPVTGQTVTKNDIAGPGELVGEFGSVLMPTSEGGGAKMLGVDFNSRAVVLDTMGGREMIPDFGVERNRFEIPAVAMVVQADGSVVIRSQASDKANPVREDMEANYKQAIEDSNKKREPGGGSRMPGLGRQRHGRRRGRKRNMGPGPLNHGPRRARRGRLLGASAGLAGLPRTREGTDRPGRAGPGRLRERNRETA